MITEDYVSFEVAKLLKEKGFDEHCFCVNYPSPEGEHYSIILPNLLNNSMIPFTDEYKFCRYKEDFITIPTLQMAMKWLREKHNLFIQIEFDPPVFSSDIFKMDEVDEYGGAKHIPPTFANTKSYESSCEAAIKYCLENLI